MIPQERTWQITEAPFQPGRLYHSETIFTIGNGYMGIRAAFEEGYPREMVSTLVHGIFDHAAGELVPELFNFPNPLPGGIEGGGETFHKKHGRGLGDKRRRDI